MISGILGKRIHGSQVQLERTRKGKEEVECVAGTESLFIVAEAGGIGTHNGRGNNRLDEDLCLDLRRNYCKCELSLWRVDQEVPEKVWVLFGDAK